MKIAIATVLHDPNLIVHRKFMELAVKHRDIYNEYFFVVVSKDTPTFPYSVTIPESTIFVQSGKGIADARRCALRWFLSIPKFNIYDRILLADFDRLLYWLEHDKASLVTILKDVYSPYTIVGRTEEAMQSHPDMQRSTERAINAYLFTNLYPEESVQDVLAGTYLMDRAMADITSSYSFALHPGAVDVEWYAIARKSLEPDEIIYSKVDGLGYEGAWVGTEIYQFSSCGTVIPHNLSYDEALERKRYDNLYESRAMVDIIRTWRKLS